MPRYCGDSDKLITRGYLISLYSSHDGAIVMENSVIPILDFDGLSFDDIFRMRDYVDFASRDKCWRAYKTLNGWRVFIDKSFNWRSKEDIKWFKRFVPFGMDEKYLEFCLERESFAARISPKIERKDKSQNRCIARFRFSSSSFSHPPSDDFVELIQFHDRACCKKKAILC